jgi:hypothetical protein
MEHQKLEPKHVEKMTLMDRILMRILEVSTLELVVGTAHLVLFFGVVFLGFGEGGGHG